jgi:hypothetical protein
LLLSPLSFVLKQSDSYSWPITLVLPVDGGRREKHTFDGEFRRLPQSRINEIIRLARAMERGRIEEGEELQDQDAAREVLVGWSGVVDDDGKEIKFSDAALTQLLEIPTVAAQIVRAWFDSLEVAKRKN